jgi:hypothetical protein
MDHSEKLILLFKILGNCGLPGDKLLVFSKSIITQDLIEEFLAKQYSDDKSEPGKCYLCRFLLVSISQVRVITHYDLQLPPLYCQD